MAIRIRKIDDGEMFEGKIIYKYVALCAAESKSQKGDIYLDDAIHGALDKKFYDDFKEMGFIREKEEM